MNPAQLQAAFNLPPRNALDLFRSKGDLASWHWWETEAQAHAHAFTVAKALALDVRMAIRTSLDAALAEGTTLAEFQRTLTPRLQQLGWWGRQIVVDSQGGAEVAQLGSARRLQTIFQTNLQTAYMAGRYQSMLENADRQPYWRYTAVLDARTRDNHRALHGKVYRWDDPVWKVIYPPNGFNCRCHVWPLSAAALAEEGGRVETGEVVQRQVDIGKDLRTGELKRVQLEGVSYRDALGHSKVFYPDPGWDHSPGALAFGADMALARKLSAIDNPALRQQLIQQINGNPARQQVFAQWVAAALEKRRPGHDAQVLGIMDVSLADKVAEKSGMPPVRVLLLTEKALLHADSARHQAKGVALSLAEYQALPTMLDKPSAVLWDKQHANLLYVYTVLGTDPAIKVVVEATYQVKAGQFDVAINAYKVPVADLRSATVYELLQGELP